MVDKSYVADRREYSPSGGRTGGGWMTVWWDGARKAYVDGGVHETKAQAQNAIREQRERDAEVSAAARALRAIPSEARAQASRENGKRGGRPLGVAVYAIPTDDRTCWDGILLPDTAASKSGAIRAARRAGYRVMTVGGCIEQQEPDGEAPRWLVSVYR